ncbi:MAG: hypothetical protein HWE23_04575 [Rhodobacteraceae bacterium]|nr:hypothetical protein [Paracoccaceae bacterium]
MAAAPTLTLHPELHELRACNLHFAKGKTWDFETENQQTIADHWQRETAKNPNMWNGRQVKLVDYGFENGILTGECVETSFAAYLTWRDLGAPDKKAGNLFGSALLRSRDGALLFGVMADTTANAGKIYPPGGNLDLSDIRDDGTIDMDRSTYRELEEETGLTRQDVVPRERFIVFDGVRISATILMDVAIDADQLRQQILDFSFASEEQEIADIRILRSYADLKDPMLVPYAKKLAKHILPS